MTLKTKIPLYTSIILIVSILIIAGFSLYKFKAYVTQNIKDYRQEQLTITLNHLKDIVNIAYNMIDNSYRSSQEAIKRYGFNFQDTVPEDIAKMIEVNMLKITLEQLRVLRFGKDGYIWINEFDPPYTVVMHGTKPELEGKAWIFYIEGTDINVYKAFHDSILVGGGEGRVTYHFYRPGTKERVPKISWVRLYKPLRWVIGTGVYVDEIDKAVAKKTAELKHQLNMMVQSIILLTVVLLAIGLFVIYLLARSIIVPIYEVRSRLQELSLGKISDEEVEIIPNEIGEMQASLQELIDGLKRYTGFAQEIGRGNFDAEFTPLSNYDTLGNELLKMRDSLKAARLAEQKRMEEEKIRHWEATGLTLFSDLITANSADIERLTEVVLNNLLSFVKVELGGIFLLRFPPDYPETRPYLELVSAIAYDRKKYYLKKLEINEGLVGACFTEAQSVYITDIPDNYIEIKTGMGSAKPKNIFLAPIKYEDRVLGVLEIASLKELKDYERNFIEQVAQSMAVSLSTHSYYVGRKFNVDDWF